ncbi:Rhomboid family protein [Botrimarina colliarenosi]|uniref:Rhomboid family protein n=1 Tax=Botrimarina colliarenosi TaxID=2528001 RepID=A0A5C6AKK5_9BACT|nr:rhomboid family intramembrane serine protease [Botrimarina colliarenosi]TWU00555.1 Rhomboid family protein [Botrimarina colliarenosi]
MFLPYATDAPVYHWPVATVGLIVVNTLALVGVGSGVLPMDPLTGSPWVLQYGQGLHPEEWILSPFLHAGFGHLLGNMIFLWVFGLVVEGKLGPARFLAVYLAIATGESAVEQVLMLGVSDGGSLGASSAIYGLMAMAAIWAPENSISFFIWLAFTPMTVEIPILVVAVLYVALDLALAIVWGGVFGLGLTSGVLHLLGAAIGAPIGILLLKRKVVDCEGWDLFTRYCGNKKPKKKPAANLQAETRQATRLAEREAQTLTGAAEQVTAYLQAGNPGAAATLYGKMRGVGGGLQLETTVLQQLVNGLQAEERWSDVAPLLADLIDLAPQAADGLRVKLAHVCVAKLDRPGRALELLSAVNAKALTDKQRAAARRILARARAMQAEGVVELDDGGW